jgi:hypothetical protein
MIGVTNDLEHAVLLVIFSAHKLDGRMRLQLIDVKKGGVDSWRLFGMKSSRFCFSCLPFPSLSVLLIFSSVSLLFQTFMLHFYFGSPLVSFHAPFSTLSFACMLATRSIVHTDRLVIVAPLQLSTNVFLSPSDSGVFTYC